MNKSNFEVLPLTIKQVEQKKKEQQGAIKKRLTKLNAKGEGCYILHFPNGKSYIGKTKDLWKTLKRLLSNIKKTKETIETWYDLAALENFYLIKDEKDIEIEVIKTKNYKDKYKELKSQVPKAERKSYYNMRW